MKRRTLFCVYAAILVLTVPVFLWWDNNPRQTQRTTKQWLVLQNSDTDVGQRLLQHLVYRRDAGTLNHDAQHESIDRVIQREFHNSVSQQDIYKYQVEQQTANDTQYVNSGSPPGVHISFVGSPITGTTGWKGWFSCPEVQLLYIVTSRDEALVVESGYIPAGQQLTLWERQFPMDAYIVLYVGSFTGEWYQLYSRNIQDCIDRELDLYVRGTESKTGKGWAYVSARPDHVASTCKFELIRGSLNCTQWIQ